MLKKNRKELKRIYNEEYNKALAKEKGQSLDKEIERIKKKARADAKRKTQSKKLRLEQKAKKLSETGKKIGKTARKTAKKYHKKLEAVDTLMAEDFRF